ncbi:MAG TPA: Ig-like domain-containing protein, partial [Gemmatimonadaceae bacterium]|nr:Ig-like domain-containing protein [Gemmatimonadaceae bacterium]
TDSTGTTSVTLTLAATAGANLVTASLSDGGPSVTFKETGVVGAAANVAKVAGDNQVGTPNTLLPVKPQVRVTDGHGNPVPGWSVAFSVTGGGGSVTGATPVTDDQGLASVGGWTLGASGPQSLKATVNGVSVTFTASAGAPAPSAATSLRFTTQPSNAPSVTYITPSIQVSVLDQYGNVMTSGTGSTARVALGVLHGPVGGVIRDSVGFAGDTVNAVAGVATFKVGGNIAGTYKPLATSPGLASDSSAAFSITVGTPNRVQYVSGDGQTALANDSLPLRPTVIVQDGGGNPVPLGKVVFVVDSGVGSINVPPQPGPAVAVDTVTADGAGHASVKWFLCGCASQELIAFTPGSSVDTVRFHATVIQPATQIAITSQMNQSYASNTHLPLVAQLEDDNGNPVRQAGVALIARVMLNIDYNRAAPSRAPRGARVQRAPGSRAPAPAPSLVPQLLPSPYERLSRALAQSRVRRIVVGGRARRDVTMSTSGVWDSLPSVPQPYLYGAVVAVTDSTGAAAFPSLYVAGAVNQYFGLEVDDTSSTSTLYPAYDYTGYYLTPGAPANVLAAYDSVHQAIGQPVIDAPQAFVADSAGNGVPGVPVTLSIAAGGGSLSSTSATSDASGFVTLTGWMLGASPGVNQATASVAVGQATRSATLTATGHAPGALGMLVDLPLSVVDSVTISPAPQVQVLDSTSTWALNAPGVVITPAVRLSPPKDVQSPRLVGSTNAVTSGTDGSATFSGVGIVGTFGSTVQMVFTAPNLIGVASDTASIASGPAASLGVPMGESLDSTHVVGATTRQVAVLATDTSRYGVGGVPVTFTLTGTGSTCQLPGNASSYTTNTSASGQAFATISLQAAAGSCAIVATSTAVPSQVVTFRELVVPPNHDTWLGLQDNNWQNAANWSTSAVPTAADSVFVPYALTYGAFGGNAPMLGAAADVATLLVENGAQLDLNGYAMNVHGNLGNGTSSAWTTATQDRGSIVMLAPGASVAGVLPYKLVIGDGTAACPGGAPVKASGTLSADSLVINCPFDVNGVTLNVSGDMTVTHHGILQATTGNPQMFVGRNFTVNSDQASTNLMTAGDLQIVGNFVEDTVATMPGSYHNFDPGAGFSVTMREYGYNYGSPASISFTSPYAQFGALYIAQGGSTVTLNGSNGQAYTVNGLLSIGNTIYPPATLVIPAGITLNVQSTFSIGSNGRVQVSGAMHLAQTWQCQVQSFVTMLGSGTVTPACSTP